MRFCVFRKSRCALYAKVLKIGLKYIELEKLDDRWSAEDLRREKLHPLACVWKCVSRANGDFPEAVKGVRTLLRSRSTNLLAVKLHAIETMCELYRANVHRTRRYWSSSNQLKRAIETGSTE